LILNTLFSTESIHITEQNGWNDQNDDTYEAGNQFVSGLTWQNLFGKNGFNKLTIYGSNTKFETIIKKGFKVIDESDNSESTIAIKDELFYKFNDSFETNSGFNIKYYDTDYNVFSPKDTLYYWGINPLNPDSAEYDIQGDIRELDAQDFEKKIKKRFYKIGGYTEINLPISNKLNFNLGARADYFSLNEKATISPRAGISYNFGDFNFKTAGGRYFQLPKLDFFLNNYQDDLRDLSSYYNDQIIFGVDYLYDNDIKITNEVYYKKYNDIPGYIETESIGSNGVIINDYEIKNINEGYSFGYEFFLQKKLTDTYYYTISYSLSRSYEYQLDESNNKIDYDKKIPTDWDYRNVLSVLAGAKYKMNNYNWYKNYWNGKWWSYLFPLIGEETELSLKSKYLGGRPYTPRSYNRDLHEWTEDDENSENSMRYPFYQRTDLRIDARYFYDNINFVFFFEWNTIDSVSI